LKQTQARPRRLSTPWDDETSKLRVMDYLQKWLGDNLKEMPANALSDSSPGHATARADEVIVRGARRRDRRPIIGPLRSTYPPFDCTA
jgi:hypothetical protein